MQLAEEGEETTGGAPPASLRRSWRPRSVGRRLAGILSAVAARQATGGSKNVQFTVMRESEGDRPKVIPTGQPRDFRPARMTDDSSSSSSSTDEDGIVLSPPHSRLPRSLWSDPRPEPVAVRAT